VNRFRTASETIRSISRLPDDRCLRPLGVHLVYAIADPQHFKPSV
jgi:hypothetical protein